MKKVFCIGLAVAFVALMGACNKECVCTRTTTAVENADTTATADSTEATPNVDNNEFHALHIYDKKECEYLNVSDTTTSQIVTLECSMDKIEK